MRIDKDLEPDYFYIQDNLNRILEENCSVDIFLLLKGLSAVMCMAKLII